MNSIVIIDYGSGNLRSVAKALEHVVPQHKVQVSADAATLEHATHIILPGVGAFADCMKGLQSIPGMLAALQEQVLERKKPFLGICVGMQMLFERGFEHGEHKGLGWIEGDVVPFTPKPGLKIPHMGWNELSFATNHPLLKDITSKAHAYFVHSYHAKCKNAADVIATTEYAQPVTAIVARGNIMGTQFHPEKSQETGLTLLKNFCGINLL